MHPLTRQLATVMASNDGIPRVIKHASTIFLVTPEGEVWRIFDSDGPDGERRSEPANDPEVWARIFIGSGPKSVTRIYRFAFGESRSIAAEALVDQLRRSTIGDERDA
jgi:hypothetical protein